MADVKFHITDFLVAPSIQISHFLADNKQLVICSGVNPSYKLGVIYKDLGYSKVGSALQANKSITGLHNFRQSLATQKILATVNNSGDTATQLFYSTGSSWTELTDAETAWTNYEDCKVEMEDFIGYCFFVGYDSTDSVFLPPRSLTDTTFGTTNTTSMPSAKYIKRYRDRLYIANCDITGTAYPYRVYFSSIPSAGAITWTVASDFFDVDYSEGIMGLGQNWDRLLIFTEYSTYIYNQDTTKKLADIGCANGRTIRNVDDITIWADSNNVWASRGGKPVPIGNNILDLLRNSTISNWTSTVVDREYNFYVGNTSSDGISYTNVMLTYNLQTGMWRWRELYDTITIVGKYNVSGKDFLLLGANDGEVHKKSKYTDTTPVYSDNGSAISAWFRTKAYDFGDPSIQKSIKKIIAYTEYGSGLELRFRIFNKNQESIMNFEHIGNLNKIVNSFDKTISGHFIQFECKEYSTSQTFRFHGLSILLEAFTKI